MESTYEDRADDFRAFHKANPHIYTAIVDKCREARDRGFKRWSMDAILNVLRWDRSVKTHNDGFKISNNHRSFYAIMVENRNPDLRGFFIIKANPERDAILKAKGVKWGKP